MSTINVRFAMIDGRTFSINLKSTASLRELKDAASLHLTVPADKLIMVYLGRPLIQEQSLQSLQIRDGSVVHVVNRFIGGINN
jgi:hypothetical protein